MSSYTVVGASRGIGLEFVRQLSLSPSNEVFAIVRDTDAPCLKTLAERENVHVVHGDLLKSNSLKEAAVQVGKITGGKLDVLINNAAFTDLKSARLTLDEYPEEQLEKDLESSYQVNVLGIVRTVNAFLPLLKAGATKKVVTISSGRAVLEFSLDNGLADAIPYSISRAGTNMVNTKYAAKFKEEGFVFVAITPGMIDTSGTQPNSDQLLVLERMVAKLQVNYPLFEGPMNPETAVGMLLGLVNNLKPADNGRFMSHRGDTMWP